MEKNIIIFMIFFVYTSLDGMLRHPFIYSHGIASCQAKAVSYINAAIIPNSSKRFNYSDAYLSFEPPHGHRCTFDFWRSCIGQADDAERLAQEVDKHHEPVVLAGESRGASTILNYLGSSLYMQRFRVAAAVLDSPFDKVESVIEHQLDILRLRAIIDPQNIEKALPYICWRYNPQGMQPIRSLETIEQKDIPTLLICSAQDTIVPPRCSFRLYTKARVLGYAKVHLLALAEGKHGWIMQGPCGDLYRSVVHAFYEKYQIGHDIVTSQDARQHGHYILENYCQPTLEELANQAGVRFLK